MIDQLWTPMYTHSYTGEDCDLPYVVENMLEVNDTSALENVAAIGQCFDIDLEASGNITLPILMDILSKLSPDNSEVRDTTETMPPVDDSSSNIFGVIFALLTACSLFFFMIV